MSTLWKQRKSAQRGQKLPTDSFAILIEHPQCSGHHSMCLSQSKESKVSDITELTIQRGEADHTCTYGNIKTRWSAPGKRGTGVKKRTPLGGAMSYWHMVLFQQVLRMVPAQAILLFGGKTLQLEERVGINALRKEHAWDWDKQCQSIYCLHSLASGTDSVT